VEFSKTKETILYECIEDLTRELDRVMWALSEEEQRNISELIMRTMLKSGKYIYEKSA
jgi:hypothetical protein